MKDFVHYYSLSLSVYSIQQSALVTKLSEALSLDEVNLLTLRVISILSVLRQSKSNRKHFYLTK